VGKLSFVRVYSGVLRRGDSVLNAATGKDERIGRLVRMHADERLELEELHAGDIGAVLGFKSGKTGHTLCASERPVALEQISFPAPVIEVAVTMRNRADRDKLGVALQRLSEEDPTLLIRQDENTEQTILAGMGELHLDVVVDRLKREFSVDVTVGAPKVAYCETITRPAKVEGRLVKQTGGHGQYAVVEIALEPLETGAGFVFENKIQGGAIPKEYIPAVEAGILDAMKAGPLAKQPVVDIKVTLVDGKYHEVDSSEMAFRTAGSMALRGGVLRGAPILMEPIMKVEVVAPQEYTGDIIQDLSSRGAQVMGLELLDTGIQTLLAHVALARMFGYATTLRSSTQGRGNFSMEFSHYQQVSEAVSRELVSRTA